jgi:hypothetical protein
MKELNLLTIILEFKYLWETGATFVMFKIRSETVSGWRGEIRNGWEREKFEG